MDSILINGGNPLHGDIKLSGSKNASLPIMAAALLTDQPVHLSNIPKLTDIYTMEKLLKNHGADISIQHTSSGLDMTITCGKITDYKTPYDIVRKMRASIWVLGPLVARFGSAKVSLPGGCAIGTRPIDLHLAVLESMGVEFNIKHGYVNVKNNKRLKGTHFNFDKNSVGATVTGIMAATLAKGESVLSNCAIEPEIVDLCHCLNKMGAHIEGIGGKEVRIIGKDKLHGTSYKVMPDRIEAGTYMISAAITKGDLNIYGIDYHLIENIALKLLEAGLQVTELKNGVRVKYIDKIRSIDIQTQPYPGFSTDLQAQFLSLMTLSDGVSVITENIFENRFMHVPELCRMGANISINSNNAIIYGVDKLSGAEVMASDLRASVSLVLAGLAASGETKVRRIYHLDRGYEALEEKLINCGADICRIKSDSI